jgi:hypothetical protein
MPARFTSRQLLSAAIVAGSVLFLGWAFSSVFVSDATRECRRMYGAARTAADTATVEATVPRGSYRTREPRSCGSYRKAARWFVIG